MSELIQKHDNRAAIRWKLLTSVSVATLLISAYGTGEALAADGDSDRPIVWIELGGQLSHLGDSQEIFAPALFSGRPSMFSSSTRYEGFPPNSIDETGKISFEPQGSDWVFSAAVRYGRSDAKRHYHQQTYPQHFFTSFYLNGYHFTHRVNPAAAKFADTMVDNEENHLILDFQAGKDVGLGLFGRDNGSSVLSAGVRFAHFATRTNIAIGSIPDWHFAYVTYHFPSIGLPTYRNVLGQPYHSNSANLVATRSFRGVGPSISWNASAPFAGNVENGELAFDWGVNVALLFGKQKAKTHHQTTGRSNPGTYYNDRNARPITFQGPGTPDHTRSRSVTIPNVGAFAGATYRIKNFKVSAGYRADFFLGAMDNGIDARKSQSIGFFGPFASISVGLGD